MSELPKLPTFSEYEPRLYRFWEKKAFFTPPIDENKDPYTILLPPPNANDPLHVGHAMYVIEDILCRYHRMKGRPTLFLPGTDHAGIETQYVFEKKLAGKSKSRFDYDRATLYRLINNYVEENRGIAKQQLKRLGFSLDWTREKYTLDPQILAIVFDTFRKLHTDGLIYRAQRLVNYCTHCGTSFSNLEINHVTRKDKLYFIDYQTLTIATTRPETIFADVAVAVHPQDERYQELIGERATIPIINRKVPVIADKAVDSEFGTGALKITPGHDALDYEIGEKHQLERLSVIGREGQMINVPKGFEGLTVEEAREKTLRRLRRLGRLLKEESFSHSVAVCYRCKGTIEPLLVPQWYVKVEPLVDLVERAVRNQQVRFFPPRFKKELLHWLEKAPDWNISRQIVWGPRIPAWYCLECNPQIEVSLLDQEKKPVIGRVADLLTAVSFEVVQRGLQTLVAPIGASYHLKEGRCRKCKSDKVLQETDTFDTWFSSGQWPFAVFGEAENSSSSKFKVQSSKLSDFEYFYPTSVLDTMWDILPFWVMRMLMLGIYRTGKVPFEWVHLHSRVVDHEGKKMSKSLGNVINPIDVVDEYGADALRWALVFGTAPASDIPLGMEKLVGARNFITKLWNISRFVLGQNEKLKAQSVEVKAAVQNLKLAEDRVLMTQLNELIRSVTRHLNNFRFSQAVEELHQFVWHEFADNYVEEFKSRSASFESLCALRFALCTLLKLLHPFIPFVTEEIYQKLSGQEAESIVISLWPKEIDL